MKIKKIDFNKVQVLITAVDLMTFDMDIDSLRPNSPTLHTFLFEIMDKIQSETGFNPNNGQIVIEASQAGEESIMLTVTKLSKDASAARRILPEQLKHVKGVIKQPKKKVSVYTFSSFDDVRRLLIRLDDDTLSNGRLYEMEDNYFLEIYLPSADRTHTLISEYAQKREVSELTAAYLHEHAKIIAEHERLQSLADGIRRYQL